jgi:hypothetical protein
MNKYTVQGCFLLHAQHSNNFYMNVPVNYGIKNFYMFVNYTVHYFLFKRDTHILLNLKVTLKNLIFVTLTS